MAWYYNKETGEVYFNNLPTPEALIWYKMGNEPPDCEGTRHTHWHDKVQMMPAQTNAYPGPHYREEDGYIGFECPTCHCWRSGPMIESIKREDVKWRHC